MGTKLILGLLIFLTLSTDVLSNPFTDPLLTFLYSTPYNYQPKAQGYSVEEPEGYPGHDYTSEPEHYSWDNLYLCDYCDLEVIIDPYADMNPDGVYDLIE